MRAFRSMKKIQVTAIGTVRSTRREAIDDLWDGEEASIELNSDFSPDALLGLSDFSHVEILFFMDQVESQKIEVGAHHPHNNTEWPKVGIFAQRGKNRPNQIGATVCEIISVVGRVLTVKGLDAIDGTPVLDIKPWVKEFAPRGAVKQPAWITELMEKYW